MGRLPGGAVGSTCARVLPVRSSIARRPISLFVEIEAPHNMRLPEREERWSLRYSRSATIPPLPRPPGVGAVESAIRPYRLRPPPTTSARA